MENKYMSSLCRKTEDLLLFQIIPLSEELIKLMKKIIRKSDT